LLPASYITGWTISLEAEDPDLVRALELLGVRLVER
jgi:hypothetical protein